MTRLMAALLSSSWVLSSSAADLNAQPRKPAPKPVVYKVGDVVGNFKLPDVDGKEVSLSDFKGRPIFVHYFRKDCGHCREESPLIEKEIWRPFRDQGLVVLGLTLDAPDVAKAYMKENDLTFTVLIDKDREFMRSLEVTGVPSTIVIGHDGKVLYNKEIGRAHV